MAKDVYGVSEVKIGEYIVRKNRIYKKIDVEHCKPVKDYDFSLEKKEKGELKSIAKTARLATADDVIDFSDLKNSINQYLIKMRNDWNTNIVVSPLFGNTRIRFDGDSFNHFYNAKRKSRDSSEIQNGPFVCLLSEIFLSVQG